MRKRFVCTVIVTTVLLCVCASFFGCAYRASEHTVKYSYDEGGYISCEDLRLCYTVADGEDAPSVVAVPYPGYSFVGWSDGVTSAERRDTAVTSDIDVTAKFIRHQHNLSYIAGEHGMIEGETNQIVEQWRDGKTVKAVATDRGYEFVRWSDGVTTAERTDTEVTDSISVWAEFGFISRKYALDYRRSFSDAVNKPEITLDFDALDGVKLPVPEKEHFKFKGWYYGEQQVADEHGDLLVDNDFVTKQPEHDEWGFARNIEAKWEAKETFTFKILLVFVTRIQAQLIDRYGEYHDIDYTMTALQRRFCTDSARLLRKQMNEMCDGLVNFEITEYFTEQIVGNESITQTHPVYQGKMETYLDPSRIPEVSGMLKNYDAALSVYGFFGDDPTYEEMRLFQDTAGYAVKREGNVCLDEQIYRSLEYLPTIFLNKLEWLLDHGNICGMKYWIRALDVYAHELAHTIEERISGLLDYHFALKSGLPTWDIERLYYLNAMDIDGEPGGIPYEFWKGEIVKVQYLVEKESEEFPFGFIHEQYWDVTGGVEEQEVIYGGHANGVIAEPQSGFRFVKWSDGLENAVRRDYYITKDLIVTAMFEPITYTVKFIAGEGGYVQKKNDPTPSSILEFPIHLREFTPYVRAVPQEGYKFVRWSDGDTDPYRNVFFQYTEIDSVDENKTYVVTAIFAPSEG